MTRIQRKKFKAEAQISFAMLWSAVFMISTGLLEASATYPGERSIGIDIATTVCFALGTTFYWLAVSGYL
jgi:hypothetical protein